MTDNLGTFIVEAFEFIIGGLLLLASVLVLILALPGDQTWSDDVLEFLRTSDQGVLVATIGIGLSYAAGVVGEGGCRWLYEPQLERMTARHQPFRDELDLPPVGKTRPDAEQRKILVTERERERVYVMSRHPRINSEVESQLKRLRMERMTSVAAAIFTIAFIVRLEWVSAAISLLITVYLVWLVFQRLGRFCSRISSSYAHGRAEEKAGPPRFAGDSTT